MVFFQSIESVISIILMIGLGYVLKSLGWFDEQFGGSISSLITKVALPASIFVSVMKNLTKSSLIELSGSLIYPIAAVIISYLIAYILTELLKIQPGRRGIFMNAVVNANTIFIGLPLNIALFGEASLPYFLIYYVTNTVSTWAFGVFLIANDDPTKDQTEKKTKLNWKKLLPAPLLGFILALFFLVLEIPVPDFVNSTLNYVGGIVTPFILIGLMVIGKYAFGAELAPLLKQTLIVQSATPMLAVLPILANEAHGDVKYATNLVTTSTLLFVFVVPILMQLIQYI